MNILKQAAESLNLRTQRVGLKPEERRFSTKESVLGPYGEIMFGGAYLHEGKRYLGPVIEVSYGSNNNSRVKAETLAAFLMEKTKDIGGKALITPCPNVTPYVVLMIPANVVVNSFPHDEFKYHISKMVREFKRSTAPAFNAPMFQMCYETGEMEHYAFVEESIVEGAFVPTWVIQEKFGQRRRIRTSVSNGYRFTEAEARADYVADLREAFDNAVEARNRYQGEADRLAELIKKNTDN